MRKGIALIITLLVASILIILVSQMLIVQQTYKTSTENQVDDLQNWYAIKSGYYIAKAYLEYDAQKHKDADHLNENWAKPIRQKIGSADLTIYIEDAQSKINLSCLVTANDAINNKLKSILDNLLDYLGYPKDVSEKIIDYIDKNNVGQYEEGAANRNFFTIDEIIRVREIPREVLFGKVQDNIKIPGILKFITVWPKPIGGIAIDWKININTAPKEIIMALSDKMTEEVANKIIDYRSSQDEKGNYRYFKTVGDLKNVSEVTEEIYNSIKDLITVRSNCFEIKPVSRIGPLEKAWYYAVYREPTGKLIRLVSHRLNEFYYYKPEE